MDWDAVGAIGQAVSALALVIVIVQVRHARQEMRRAAVLTRLQGSRDLNALWATNEHLWSSVDRAAHAFGLELGQFGRFLTNKGVSREDVWRIAWYQLGTWQNYETSIESIDHLSPGVREETDMSIKRNYANPVFAKWFEMTKPTLNPDAVRYVENLLARPQ